MPRLTLSIIIVSWNVRSLLREALQSLFATKQAIDFEVIVIDNNSSDNSAEMVAAEFPQVKLINNQANVGFAQACNQGAKISRGEYLLFLNDDTKIFDHTLAGCVYYLQKNPMIGALGCSIKNPDGSQQRSVRDLPNLSDQIIVLLKLHNFFPKLIKKYLNLDFDYTKLQEVEQVMGAFFFTSSQVFTELTGFDEGYYIWFEEVDYCRRLKEKGYQVIYYPQEKIIHYGGASLQQRPAVAELLFFSSRLW